MKTIGYIRVSSKKQIDNNSLELQKEKIEKYADYKDLGEVTIYADEGISGRSVDKRESLKQVMELIKQGAVAHFIVYSISRMGRNLKESVELSEMLNKHNVRLHILDLDIDTSNANGKMVFGIMASIAQYKSDDLSDKVKETISYLKEEGVQHSRPILGFSQSGKGSKLQPIPEEMQTVKRVFSLRRNGASMICIARELNDSGQKSKRGGKFYESTVKKILEKETLYAKFT